MYAPEIDHVLRHCVPEFRGVYAADRLPPFGAGSLVVNTDPHDKSGNHWIAIKVNREWFTGHLDVEYFDSYGLAPLPQFKEYLRGYPIQYNKEMLQDLDTNVCGQYCIYFLFYRSGGVSMHDIIRNLKRKGEKNDIIVKRFVDRLNVINCKRGQTCCCRTSYSSN